MATSIIPFVLIADLVIPTGCCAQKNWRLLRNRVLAAAYVSH